MLYLVIINGLIDSFNPCAVGVLILYVTLLISLSIKRYYLLLFGFFYLISIYATYFLIGMGILKVLHLFGIHNFFGWVAAFIILLLGLFSLKEYFFPQWYIPILTPLLSRCRLPASLNKNFSILSGIVLGFLVGLCEFPCSGGIYLATVALLSAKETFADGLGYLLIYNFMFILPLVIIFIIATNKKLFDYIKKIQGKSFGITKLIMGLTMIFSGILLLIWLIK